MSTLSVGPGQQFSRLSDAVAAAGDGDLIRIQAGTYTNDFTTIAKRLTIEGVGGVAKLVATESGYEAADTALQLHGGYGYLHEYGVEKLVRDLRVHRILEGSNEIMRMIVGRGLIG